MLSVARYLFLIWSLVISTRSYCFQQEMKTEPEIKKVVENFCAVEFQGKLTDEERGTLVRYTSDSEDYKKFAILSKKITDGEHLYPYEWNMDNDPLFIIEAYNVVDVKQVDEKHAYAIVYYHQLAKRYPSLSPAGGNEIPVKDIRKIAVKLNLEYRRKRWKVVDPPYPKVSYDAILKYYNEQISKQQNGLQYVNNSKKVVLDFLINLKKLAQ